MCAKCGQLVQLADIKAHMRNHLMEVNDSIIECIKCKHQSNPTDFYNHLITNHGFAPQKITKIVVKRHVKYQDPLAIVAVVSKKTNAM